MINTSLKLSTLCLLFFLNTNVHADQAMFAMGRIWSAESFFRSSDNNSKLPGIISIRSGFTGGSGSDPSYKQHKGFQQVVELEFNPLVIEYAELLDLFWHGIDPFDSKGQFCDKGDEYKTAIYYFSPEQQKAAEASKQELEKRLGKQFYTPIKPATTFYPAEEAHQDYKTKSPLKYAFYSWRCGREDALNKIWGDRMGTGETAADF